MADNIISIDENELLQDGAALTVSGTVMLISDTIAETLLKFYENGNISGTLNIMTGDFYFTSGNNKIAWSIGDTLEIGDTIKLSKDTIGTSAIKRQNGTDVYLKVTGRKFKYDGCPLVDIEFSEVKDVF